MPLDPELFSPDQPDTIGAYQRSMQSQLQDINRVLASIGQQNANDQYSKTEVLLARIKMLLDDAERLHLWSESRRQQLPAESARLGALQYWTKASQKLN